MHAYFKKEIVTKGFQPAVQGEVDDYLYFINKGKFDVLISVDKIQGVQKFGLSEGEKFLVINSLKKGDNFGDFASLRDTTHPFTVEAVSEKAEYYKIHRSHFFHNFSKLDMDPTQEIKG